MKCAILHYEPGLDEEGRIGSVENSKLLAVPSFRQGVGLDCESVGGFDGFPDAGERYFEDVDHFVVSVRFVGGSGVFKQ